MVIIKRKTMVEKIKAVLGSIRFWIFTFGAAAVIAGYIEANGFQVSYLLNGIAGWLGLVGGVGTLDGFIEKYSKAKNQG